MATNFKYAGQSELTKYFNRVGDFDSKRQLYNFTETDSTQSQVVDSYIHPDSSLVNNLYRDSHDLGSGKQTIGTAARTAINSGSIASTTTTIAVDDGSRLTDETYIKVKDEILYITNISGNNLTVVRGRLGTSAESLDDDSSIYNHFNPSADGQWLYDSDNDFVIMASSSTPNDNLIEAGEDYSDFIDQILVDASLELHNYLDARYSTPLEKIKQIDVDTAAVSTLEEYDPIIIKAVCYIATSNLIRAKEGPSEEADYFMNLVTNPERTGLIDKLNDGIFKLSSEVDANDKKGSIRYRNVSGTMDIVELSGTYHGESYDLLKVEIEATGAYGTGTFKVHYLSNNQLFGATSSAEKITGGLQHIHGGLYGRFQGASATDGDIWEIEVYGSHRKQTNKSNATIEMVR